MDGQVQAALGTWQDVTANTISSLAAVQKAVNAIAMRMVSKAYSAWQHLAREIREHRSVVARAVTSWNAVLQGKLFRVWFVLSEEMKDGVKAYSSGSDSGLGWTVHGGLGGRARVRGS